MPISRMQQPRQMYGLGSFVKKAVKGVTGAIKKIAGSGLGKAALLGLGGAGLMGMGPLSALGGLGASSGTGIASILSKGKSLLGGLTTGQRLAGSLGLAALASAPQEVQEESSRDIGALRKYLASYYENLGYSADEIAENVARDTAEYTSGAGGYAEGGRIGYNEGTGDPTYTGNNIEDLPRGLQIDTTTSNPIPDDAPQQEISEVAKIMLGPGRSGIGEPEDGTMKGYQFFRKKYLPKKVTEIAENYGIEENEVLRMIRDEMMQYIDAPKSLEKPEMAKGGRMGYNEGTPEMGMIDPNKAKQAKQMIGMGADQDLISTITGLTKEQVEFLMREDKAYGGRMGFAMGNPEENAFY